MHSSTQQTGCDEPAGEDTPYWSLPAPQLFAQLGTSENGLSAGTAAARLAQNGPNAVADESLGAAVSILLRQFRSPLVLVLLVTIPAGSRLNFLPLPLQVMIAVALISCAYVGAVELIKRRLFQFSDAGR